MVTNTKNGLVEGGISSDEVHVIDHELRAAYRNGDFPETFDVTNIQSAGANSVTADVGISSPKFTVTVTVTVTKSLLFVAQGGSWVMSHDSALALLQAASAT